MTPRDVLMRMALRLAERGDADGAAEALRGVLAMRGDDAAPERRTDGRELRGVRAPDRMQHAPRPHARPARAIACVGVGRGRRVLWTSRSR